MLSTKVDVVVLVARWRKTSAHAVQAALHLLPGEGLTVAGVVLTLCQLGVGEYQYRNGLPWQAIAVHVAIAATLVVTVVLVASLITDARRDPSDGGGSGPRVREDEG